MAAQTLQQLTASRDAAQTALDAMIASGQSYTTFGSSLQRVDARFLKDYIDDLNRRIDERTDQAAGVNPHIVIADIESGMP